MSETLMPGLQISEVIQAATFEKLYAETGIDPSIVERWRAMMERDELIIIGAMDSMGRFVGRVNVWLAPADEGLLRQEYPGTPLINALHVNEDMRGKGIGTQLIQAAETIAKREGRTSIGLGVEPDNETARRLYKKLGFEYRQIAGQQTYDVEWDETLPNGTKNHVKVPALFMYKEL